MSSSPPSCEPWAAPFREERGAGAGVEGGGGGGEAVPATCLVLMVPLEVLPREAVQAAALHLAAQQHAEESAPLLSRREARDSRRTSPIGATARAAAAKPGASSSRGSPGFTQLGGVDGFSSFGGPDVPVRSPDAAPSEPSAAPPPASANAEDRQDREGGSAAGADGVDAGAPPPPWRQH